MIHRPVILAPTYNNASTVAAVIRQVRGRNLPVIVINDGSTDDTATILRTLTEIDVVTHLINQGKAAAIQSGFLRARQLGYTHVVTIDTDGQHDAGDIPAMIDLSQSHPAALVVGTRDLALVGYPLGNRIGRQVSNFFVKLHSGVVVSDSQCGLRVYPLAVADLPARASRYGYETEVLVRCGWAYVPVMDHPVRCEYEIDTGRVSHYRPWKDSLAAVGMHARLLTRSHWPTHPMRIGQPSDTSTTGTIIERLMRWFSPLRAWRLIRKHPGERKRFAAALSLGVLIANLPIYGLQTFISLIVAKRLRLHPLAVVAGSHLSTPPIGPILILAAIATGHFLLHGQPATLASFDPGRIGYLELLRQVAIEWIIGSIVCGVSLAAITYLSVQMMLRFSLPTRES